MFVIKKHLGSELMTVKLFFPKKTIFITKSPLLNKYEEGNGNQQMYGYVRLLYGWSFIIYGFVRKKNKFY